MIKKLKKKATFSEAPSYIGKNNGAKKMTDFLKITVTVLMAIPFIYMFYDVMLDLSRKAIRITQRDNK